MKFVGRNAVVTKESSNLSELYNKRETAMECGREGEPGQVLEGGREQ